MIQQSIYFTVILSCVSFFTFAQQKTQQLVSDGLSRLAENQQTQQTIDQDLEQIQLLEKRFQDELQIVEGLDMYNAMLARQLNKQQEQIFKLESSISNATQIERQIMPLLVRMIDALESFIELDVPFLLEERRQRVQTLRSLLDQPEFTTSEKCRRVFEAYQIENEFGYTLESYKGRVQTENGQFAVDFLRIGRIGLMYRDLSGERVGFWHPQQRQWQELTGRQFKRHIEKGLKIAREEISPELITLPLLVNIEAR